MEEIKTTSISMPYDWWDTLKRLATLREVQGDKGKGQSFNSVLVETLERGMEDSRLELLEREGRRR
jgi:hypothetical protein